MKKLFKFKLKNIKFILEVKECKSIWSKFLGLMFKKESPCLLFIFNKDKKLCIHSFFCKPFIACWINSRREITKIIKISKKNINFCGYGKYLLKIPDGDNAKV
jgi:hypothetical protein